MKFFTQRLAARRAAVVVIFVALTAYQWISLIRFHGRDYSLGRPEFDPPLVPKTYNETTVKSDSQLEHLLIPEIEVVNEIIHRAFFGLGHRFHRSAAVYHLAQSLSFPQARIPSDQFQHKPTITHFRFHWESCLSSEEIQNASIVDANGVGKKEYNVFRYLFGDDLWKLNDSKDGSLLASQTTEIATKESHIDKSTTSGAKPRIRRNMIVLRNDVPGYIAGQLYKDLRLPVNHNSVNRTNFRTNKSNPSLPTQVASSNQYEVILDKVTRSDVDFYHRLVDTYQFKNDLREFQLENKWNERPLVIGLHLRAGNGEDAHFVESGRASSVDIDESTMISRLLQLINLAINHETKHLGNGKIKNDGLHPLLFVATDTAHLLPMIEKMIESSNHDHNIPRARTLEILTWPQDRLPKNAGVTFDALQGKGERCLQGWRSAMSDSLLLSKADVLVAAKRSTFTQSLPLTLGFDRNKKQSFSDTIFPATGENKVESGVAEPQSKEMAIRRNGRFTFCEVSESDLIKMTCFANARAWLFRGEDDSSYPSNKDMSERIWSFSVANASSASSGRNDSIEPVEHKVTVLLPDVDPPTEFQQAREFLRRKNTIELETSTRDSNEMYESVFPYGRSKINKKYRNSHKTVSKTNSSWNFVFNANS